jgi:amidohydrolase
MALAFGAIHGGRSGNVIPTTVELKGTVRTLDPALWESLPSLMRSALSSILDHSGAEHSLEYIQAIPPVVNDHDVVSSASTGIAAMLGEGALTTTQPSMGGEDFANYLTEVPGALFRLGTSGQGHDLHSPSFLLDEATIPHGIKAGVAALLALLEKV